MNKNLMSELMELPSGFPGIHDLSPAIAYLLGCRNFDQFCCTIRSLINPGEFCPFCEREMNRRGREATKIIDGWMLLKNEFPHTNTSQMWLVVPLDHRINIDELGPFDWVAIGNIVAWCCEMFDITGGGLLTRFGDPRLHAGTIQHLHMNIIEPISSAAYRPPLSKDSGEHAEDYERVLIFRERLLETGGEEWLFSERGIKKTQPVIG